MKQQVRNTRNILIVVALTVLSLHPSLQLFAQDSAKLKPELTVAYTGTISYQPVFQVRLYNNTEPVRLLLKDEQGDVLYSEKIRGNYHKRFQVDVSPDEPVTLIVTIVDRKGRRVHQYTVSNADKNMNDKLITSVK